MIETIRVDGSTLYVFEIVAVSVKTDYMERDKVTPHEPGLGAADLSVRSIYQVGTRRV